MNGLIQKNITEDLLYVEHWGYHSQQSRCSPSRCRALGGWGSRVGDRKTEIYSMLYGDKRHEVK